MNESAIEHQRVQTLLGYEILDTSAEGVFDKMTSLAASVFNVPIAIISLVDHDRIWFKSHHGIDAEEIARDPGLCSSAILSNEVYVVEDAENDLRCSSHPLVVGGLGVRFYAAAPIQTWTGYNLGTFCIIDRKPRRFSDDNRVILKNMADIVMENIEMRHRATRTIREFKKRFELRSSGEEFSL